MLWAEDETGVSYSIGKKKKWQWQCNSLGMSPNSGSHGSPVYFDLPSVKRANAQFEAPLWGLRQCWQMSWHRGSSSRWTLGSLQSLLPSVTLHTGEKHNECWSPSSSLLHYTSQLLPEWWPQESGAIKWSYWQRLNFVSFPSNSFVEIKAPVPQNTTFSGDQSLNRWLN